jgi:hypothetical protein
MSAGPSSSFNDTIIDDLIGKCVEEAQNEKKEKEKVIADRDELRRQLDKLTKEHEQLKSQLSNSNAERAPKANCQEIHCIRKNIIINPIEQLDHPIQVSEYLPGITANTTRSNCQNYYPFLL